MTMSVAFTHSLHSLDQSIAIDGHLLQDHQGPLYLPSERRLTYQIPSHVTSLSPINF